MKKNLTFLTGIALVIAFLSSVGCTSVETQETITVSDLPLEITEADSTIWIAVHDTLIDCYRHLVMQDKILALKNKKVVDTLTTEVKPGYTVVWVKANGAKLKKVHQVRIMDASPWNLTNSCLEGYEMEADAGKYIEFVIPSNADTGTVKYEIIFEDEDKKFWYIDPHLMIPPER